MIKGTKDRASIGSFRSGGCCEVSLLSLWYICDAQGSDIRDGCGAAGFDSVSN